MMLPLLLVCALAGGASDADDVVPAALDALLSQPDDVLQFGIPSLAPGKIVLSLPGVPTARALASLGDVTGDGAGDVAFGNSPGSFPATLQVRNGTTGDVLWSATPDGGGFRTLRGLSVRDGRLAAGLCSPHARVECRAAADGALVWARDLLPAGVAPDANILAVDWTDDLDDDGVDDLLVAGGRHVDSLVALSGADGTTLWVHDVGDNVAGSVRGPDLDRDGLGDVFATGGDDQPFLRAVAASDGTLLWSVPLPGPGSSLVLLDDVDDDLLADVAVGCFAAPAATLLAFSGADGAPLWSAASMDRDVVSLAMLSDVNGDGARDLAVGSFDNAVSCILADSGLTQWRREASTVNGGAMLAVAAVGDLDGNGGIDVATVSQDHRMYLFDGLKGFLLCTQNIRSRGGPVAALPDADGDGRAEFVATGRSSLQVLGGHSGTAAGPVLSVQPGAFSTKVCVYAYPTATLVVMGSLGTGQLVLPGYGGTFGLDLALFGVVHIGTAPAAGESGYLVDGLSREFVGLTIYYQAATIFEPGHGLLSEVVAQPLTD
ncbi:MAG: outer membrane protein assembly factor BamB family protein [Planctomycetota bacterium]|jgi:outer membrane protein assembly factor BamB